MKPALPRLCLLGALVFPLAVHAQFSPAETGSARSISGQFLVTTDPAIPLRIAPRNFATNSNFIRLEPALLAVSAERTKESLWRTLAINPNEPWRGQIRFILHPAQSPDEAAPIFSIPAANRWNYQVRLPDTLSRIRFTRTLTGVLLLEYANRNATSPDHPAEIPMWLVDGLALQLLAAGGRETIVPAPTKIVNDLPVSRTLANESGHDPLAASRRLLRDQPALTVEQLSWPTDDQLASTDGGTYRACAQVFVDELLKLKNGPAKLRTMLKILPANRNWQTAFQTAFHDNFPRPLDVEKWWALQLISFAAHDPGSAWTPAVSRAKLDEILRVPVEVRTASNALPAHVTVSLQTVIRNWDAAQQTATLLAKFHDLELAQLRMATPLSSLTDEYRRTLADYLGQKKNTPRTTIVIKHPSKQPSKSAAADTIKKLDALDVRRFKIEADLKPDTLQP